MSREQGTWVRTGTPDIERATESLETEFKELSDRIATDPLRFQQVREELARRHAAGGDQPTPDTQEQQAEKQREAVANLEKNLVLKITAMETEQAKLVVEAEIFKSQRNEAEARLALIAKIGYIVREPLSREAARALADRFKTEDNLGRVPLEWVIDAIIEASK